MSEAERLVSAIHAMTSVLSSNPSVGSSLRSILKVCVDLVDAEGGTIYMHDPVLRTLTFAYVIPAEMNERLRGHSFPDTQGIAGAAFVARKSRVDNEVERSEEHDSRYDEVTERTTRCLITVPLLVAGAEPVGVVQVLNKRSGPFTESDLLLLEIVGSVSAMVIRNSQLADEAKKATGLQAMGDIAHDIKNKVAPLTMGAMTLMIDVESLANTLQTLGVEPDIEPLHSLREIASVIVDGAQRTQRYAQLIADLAKGKDLAVSKHMGDISLVAVREFLNQQRRARQNNIELVANVNGPIIVPFDEVMLERAIYNLTLNALDATPEGGRVALNMHETDTEVVLSIADTGCGMTRDVLDRVLAGTAESSKVGGTGLGTSIVRKIAELHSGRLEAESEVGQGTTFRLILPKNGK
ncbi:MAG: GAF domain-containing sensor histidine kinase [Fimbriimonadia bacterium]